MSKSMLARTEPAAAGASPRMVRVERVGNGEPVTVIYEVAGASSATDDPTLDIDDLPTVIEAMHRLGSGDD